ncbi:unnamed protein product [Microthlaspi erraticum]|uniref:Uncharacterized protein n=1 Tax=Microthlaspi erraticum TaxID=1685480 RepID=A0A6D2KLR9_9BRAS|nr:unnamed protein product [Microthlaspi erraticum]
MLSLSIKFYSIKTNIIIRPYSSEPELSNRCNASVATVAKLGFFLIVSFPAVSELKPPKGGSGELLDCSYNGLVSKMVIKIAEDTLKIR